MSKDDCDYPDELADVNRIGGLKAVRVAAGVKACVLIAQTMEQVDDDAPALVRDAGASISQAICDVMRAIVDAAINNTGASLAVDVRVDEKGIQVTVTKQAPN